MHYNSHLSDKYAYLINFFYSQFPWPESLECTKFPEDGTDICISPNISSSSTASSTSQDSQHFNSQITSLGKVEKSQTKVQNTTAFSHRFRGFICPVQLKAPAVLGYEINIGGKIVKDCGAPCSSIFFDDKEVTTLRYMSTFSYISINCHNFFYDHLSITFFFHF